MSKRLDSPLPINQFHFWENRFKELKSKAGFQTKITLPGRKRLKIFPKHLTLLPFYDYPTFNKSKIETRLICIFKVHTRLLDLCVPDIWHVLILSHSNIKEREHVLLWGDFSFIMWLHTNFLSQNKLTKLGDAITSHLKTWLTPLYHSLTRVLLFIQRTKWMKKIFYQ